MTRWIRKDVGDESWHSNLVRVSGDNINHGSLVAIGEDVWHAHGER